MVSEMSTIVFCRKLTSKIETAIACWTMMIPSCGSFNGLQYHALSAAQLNFALRCKQLMIRGLTNLLKDAWCNQAITLKIPHRRAPDSSDPIRQHGMQDQVLA